MHEPSSGGSQNRIHTDSSNQAQPTFQPAANNNSNVLMVPSGLFMHNLPSSFNMQAGQFLQSEQPRSPLTPGTLRDSNTFSFLPTSQSDPSSVSRLPLTFSLPAWQPGTRNFDQVSHNQQHPATHPGADGRSHLPSLLSMLSADNAAAMQGLRHGLSAQHNQSLSGTSMPTLRDMPTGMCASLPNTGPASISRESSGSAKQDKPAIAAGTGHDNETLTVLPRRRAGQAEDAKRNPIVVSRRDLKDLYSLRLSEAAAKLDISVTAMKAVCRKAGITKWPYRKIQFYKSRGLQFSEEELDKAAQSGGRRKRRGSGGQKQKAREEATGSTSEDEMMDDDEGGGNSDDLRTAPAPAGRVGSSGSQGEAASPQVLLAQAQALHHLQQAHRAAYQQASALQHAQAHALQQAQAGMQHALQQQQSQSILHSALMALQQQALQRPASAPTPQPTTPQVSSFPVRRASQGEIWRQIEGAGVPQDGQPAAPGGGGQAGKASINNFLN